jgi:hypothetical protein
VGALLLDGRAYYYGILMWSDRPVEDEEEIYRHDGRIPLYGDHRLLQEHLAVDGIPVEDGVHDVIDLDRALQIVGRTMSGEENLDVVLTAWNGLDDLLPAWGLPFAFRGRIADKVCDKLFWGLNLPSVTPPGEHYVPVWRRKEIAKIVQALRAGASRIRASLADEAQNAQPRETLWLNHSIMTDPSWWETQAPVDTSSDTDNRG